MLDYYLVYYQSFIRGIQFRNIASINVIYFLNNFTLHFSSNVLKLNLNSPLTLESTGYLATFSIRCVVINFIQSPLNKKQNF